MKLMRFGFQLALLTMVLVFLGCSSIVDPRVINRWEKTRNLKPYLNAHEILQVPPILPVIFIPGIKGSVLKRRGKTLWGNTRVLFLKKLDDLVVPLPKKGIPAEQRFNQGIASRKVLGELKIRFLPVMRRVPVYSGFREILKKAGGLLNGRNVFYFHYDWRLDNRIAAVELAATLQGLRKTYEQYLEDEYCSNLGDRFPWAKCKDLIRKRWPGLFSSNGFKFNIIAHSMGGLVARYLIRGLGYGDEIDSLILFSTPNQGAMESLKALVLGELPLGEVLFRFYSRKETRPVLISFPSTFQLLPRYNAAIKGESEEEIQHSLWLTYENPDVRSALQRWSAILNYDDQDWSLICRASRETNVGQCKERFASHLEAELRSAFQFHKTIRYGLNSPVTTEEDSQYEQNKIKEAERVINAIRGKNLKRTFRESSRIESPGQTYQFFGHCDPTVAFARADKDKDELDVLKVKLDFCEGEPLAEAICGDFGDGRIPRQSFNDRSLREGQINFSEFVLCTSHFGIVNNATVQDNLLRILFRGRL